MLLDSDVLSHVGWASQCMLDSYVVPHSVLSQLKSSAMLGKSESDTYAEKCSDISKCLINWKQLDLL